VIEHLSDKLVPNGIRAPVNVSEYLAGVLPTLVLDGFLPSNAVLGRCFGEYSVVARAERKPMPVTSQI
jgi:hypothetical protein